MILIFISLYSFFDSKIVPKKQKKTSPGEAQDQWRGRKLKLSGKGEGIGGREERGKREFAKCVDYFVSIKSIMH